MYFRGLYLLERCLEEHINSKSILKHNILLVLEMLPIGTRNSIVNIEVLVQQMTSAENFGWETAELARRILERWGLLELVYKIPKRVKSDPDLDSTPETKRTRSDDEVEQLPVKYQKGQVYIPERFQSFTPTSSTESPPYTGRTSFVRPPKEELAGVLKEIEREDKFNLSWNTFVPSPIPTKSPEYGTDNDSLEQSTPTLMSESSIEQMVEAAQKSTLAGQEEARRLQQIDQREIEKIAAKNKKKLKEHKKEQRALSHSLAGMLVERARAAALGTSMVSEVLVSKTHSSKEHSKKEHKKDSSKDRKSKPYGSKERSHSSLERFGTSLKEDSKAISKERHSSVDRFSTSSHKEESKTSSKDRSETKSNVCLYLLISSYRMRLLK